MISRAVSGAILMIPTTLMLYSIGLSALHEPAFGTIIESTEVSQTTPPLPASTVAIRAPQPATASHVAMIKHCHTTGPHAALQACTARSSRL